MSAYRIAVNLEWTSKCNARCVMCPREAIAHPAIMSLDTHAQALRRIRPEDVFRVVIAGYGEPTTHPRFDPLIEQLRGHPVRFDMVSNGQMLDEARLRALDGVVTLLMISFSSIDAGVYGRVHVGLDHEAVMRNIVLAQRTLKHTRLAISLTPLEECLATLPDTIRWLRGQGVPTLTLSPTCYDRAGALDASGPSTGELRRIIRHYGLRSQELDFVGGIRNFAGQWMANRFKCIPRNVDLPIAADGQYMYCFNDASHGHPLGHVAHMTLREALTLREGTGVDASLCGQCNMRGRYGPREVASAAWHYLRS